MTSHPSSQDDLQLSGTYTANVLGTIRSHLEALQGYDVMALELIQNADDAGAREISFDVTDEALIVSNSAEFSYCGDLRHSPCQGVISHKDRPSKQCDFHSIVEVASGGKLGDSENIGRFGIGFISTYQITDSPEIHSLDLAVRLHPEVSQWSGQRTPRVVGTRLTFPWAKNSESSVRALLQLSAISNEHIGRVLDSIKTVIERSLLFLNHVTHVQLMRNGERVYSAQIDRTGSPKIYISFHGGAKAQQWLILTTDARRLLEPTIESHPRLQTLKRKTAVQIALRTDKPLAAGFLYAYLPTQQSSGLPLHINADFFPKPDRKAAIFEGNQHQQAWNQGLILAAAREIARNLERLRDVLDHENLWSLIDAAAIISQAQKSTHPDCYKTYWKELQTALAEKPNIVLTANGCSVAGSEAVLTKAELDGKAIEVSTTIGMTLVNERLRRFKNSLPSAGVQQLTLERLISYCESSAYIAALPSRTDAKGIHAFFEPLWSLIDGQITGLRVETSKPLVARLKKLRIGVTHSLEIGSLGDCFDHSTSIPRREIEENMPWAALAHSRLIGFKELKKLLPTFSLAHAVNYLDEHTKTPEKAAELLGEANWRLKSFYGLLARLDDMGPSNLETYARLSELPIWRTGAGFTSARGAMLPGGFTDPIGLATLLSPDVFDGRTIDFLRSRLKVHKQTVEAFIETVLPRFFEDTEKIDSHRYSRLMTELSEHGALLDDEHLAKILTNLPLVPTQDGGWNKPSNTYYRSDLLEEILGEAPHLWVDLTRIPNKKSVRTLLTFLGIRKKPAAKDLVRQLTQLAHAHKPTAKTLEASARTFYAVCDQFPMWKANKDTGELAEVEKLRTTVCFPADDADDRWFLSESLYSPYRAMGFDSQVKVLAFKNTHRLNSELLTLLGIEGEPPTQVVINHLRHCIQNNIPVSDVTYQILNERAVNGDPAISQLKNELSIYDKTLAKYLSPSRVFWAPQHLGGYAYTAPQHFSQFRAFLSAVGVHTEPTAEQFAAILTEITTTHFSNGSPVDGEDLAVYNSCLNRLGDDDLLTSGIDGAHMKALRESPTILNLQSLPKFPDEVLMLDSEWFRSHFGNDLDVMLCRPDSQYVALFAALGVRNLTSVSKIELDFTDGPEEREHEIEQQIRNRSECVIRLISDKSPQIRKLLKMKLSDISVNSFDQVRIRASVMLDGPFVSESKAVGAFYDDNENQLTLSRPLTDRTWPHIFNAILHRFLLEESGADVARLSAVCWSLVERKNLEDAHQYLSDIGIPISADSNETVAPESLELSNLGTTEETPRPGSVPSPGLDRPIISREPSAQPSRTPTKDSTPTSDNDRDITPTYSPKKRPEFKQKWDQALRSYARPKIEAHRDAETSSESEKRQHDLMVEAASRKIVCDWELMQGRHAEELGLTHPGYDLISTNPNTGERRLIEVKGIDGEWNKTGVSVSRTQFANAQEFGDKYWLYVVEFALDPNGARVLPIKNPAMQVSQFMFDSGWRAVATNEQGDPRDAFVPGARGDFGSWGRGTIRSRHQKSNGDILLDIDIDGIGLRHLTLSLQTMHILTSGDNNDDNL